MGAVLYGTGRTHSTYHSVFSKQASPSKEGVLCARNVSFVLTLYKTYHKELVPVPAHLWRNALLSFFACLAFGSVSRFCKGVQIAKLSWQQHLRFSYLAYSRKRRNGQHSGKWKGKNIILILQKWRRKKPKSNRPALKTSYRICTMSQALWWKKT